MRHESKALVLVRESNVVPIQRDSYQHSTGWWHEVNVKAGDGYRMSLSRKFTILAVVLLVMMAWALGLGIGLL